MVTYRCPCHDRLFQHEHDYTHHMNSVPFRSIGEGAQVGYQDWLDGIDTRKPLPKLVKPAANYMMRRLIGGYQCGPQTSRPPRQKRNSRPALSEIKNKRRMRSVAPALQKLVFVTQRSRVAEDMLRYVLNYGSGEVNDDLLPASLNTDSMQEAVSLFMALDVDGDGFICVSDLVAAGDLMGTPYNQLDFRKVDKRRTGLVTQDIFLRMIFPTFPWRRIGVVRQQLGVQQPQLLSTRDQLSSADRAEVDAIYGLFNSMPGGCTLPNMLRIMSGYQSDYASDFKKIFTKFDVDEDGVLSADEFLELIKFNYAPLKPKSSGKSSSSDVVALPAITLQNYLNDANADESTRQLFSMSRVYKVEPPRIVRDLKLVGTSECQDVGHARDTARRRQEFEDNADLLHVAPVVRRYAGEKTR